MSAVRGDLGKNTKTQQGNILNDWAVVVPMLIITILSVSKFGAYITSLTWLDHSSYHVSSLGARSLPKERGRRMQVFASALAGYHQTSFHTSDSNNLVFAPTEDSTTGVMKTSSITHGKSAFNGEILPINSAARSLPFLPLLLNDTDLSNFRNPAVLKDCCGDVGLSGSCISGTGTDAHFQDCSGTSIDVGN